MIIRDCISEKLNAGSVAEACTVIQVDNVFLWAALFILWLFAMAAIAAATRSER